MMTSTPNWNANSPWDSPVAPPSVAAPQISQSQNHGWNQNYNTAAAAVSAVSMHPPSVSSQYNQFNFGSNSYDSFRNQRTLPSPNMNHQFLGTNGLSTSGKKSFIFKNFKKNIRQIAKSYFHISTLWFHENNCVYFKVNKKFCTVFKNHRKSLIQHCERSELRLHFEWTNVN